MLAVAEVPVHMLVVAVELAYRVVVQGYTVVEPAYMGLEQGYKLAAEHLAELEQARQLVVVEQQRRLSRSSCLCKFQLLRSLLLF